MSIKYQKILLSATNKTITEYSIQDGVTSIGNNAFGNCSSLTSVTIPSDVTSIKARAFFCCSSLTSIKIPLGVTEIGSAAFLNCSNLKSVTIPNGVTSIESLVFQDCSGLTSITLPTGVTSFGQSAFLGCSSLTSVTIPESVTTIGTYAFYRCSSLTSIAIPSSVTTIGQQAFLGCKSLTSMDFSEHDTPPTLTSTPGIPYTNTGFVIYVKSGTLDTWQTATRWSNMSSYFQEKNISNTPTHTIITYNDGTSPKIVDCSDDHILIWNDTKGGSSEYGTNTTIQSVEIGSDVTSIGEGAFRGCWNLTSVTIPSNVTEIGMFAFAGCSSLTSVTIPEGMTSIGSYAFSNCSGLTNIILENRTLEEAQSLIGTTNTLGYTGTITYNDDTYNTFFNDPNAGGGA